MLSPFHNAPPDKASSLIQSLLHSHSSTLTPADYGTLTHLAHSLTPPPHTLVLSLYSAYTARHPLSAAPDDLFRYVLPVLHHHDRHAEVLQLYRHIGPRRVMDQVMLGVLLRACDVRHDGNIAWQLWDYHRAPYSTAAEKGRTEEAREQEEQTERGAGRAGEERQRGEGLARFVEESLFPHSPYHGYIHRGGFSSRTSAFNLLHYTYIVSALRYHPYRASQAMAVLQHMHQHGVRPDSLFYSRLLSTLTTKLLPACCLHVLRDMEAHGMPIDGPVYYFVITAHAARGHWTAVVRLIAEMRDRGLDVSQHIYEAAVVCCAETGQVQRAKDILAEMEHRGVPLTWRCYTALITLAGEASEWRWVLRLFALGKERADFCKQLLANDTVIEVLVQAELRGKPTTLGMTAEQAYRRYFPEHIGPRGLWLLMRRSVLAERASGSLQCGNKVRPLLKSATTPHTATHIGRMQVKLEQPTLSWSVNGSVAQRSRQYRLFVFETSVGEAVASIDILLLCMLYRAALHSGAGVTEDEEEAGWREHLSQLPACGDTLLVVSRKDKQPVSERAMRQQLRDDPVYAGTAAAALPGWMHGEADVTEVYYAAEHERYKKAEAAVQAEEAVAERVTGAAVSEAASDAYSDPAVEAMAQADTESRQSKVELPSIGQFVLHTVNSLVQLVTAPLQGEATPSSVLDIEQPGDTARLRPGHELLRGVRQHLRRVYGIKAIDTHDEDFYRLTLSPLQLTRWVEREMANRLQNRTKWKALHSERLERRRRSAKSAERRSGERVASSAGADELDDNQRTMLQQVVT